MIPKNPFGSGSAGVPASLTTLAANKPLESTGPSTPASTPFTVGGPTFVVPSNSGSGAVSGGGSGGGGGGGTSISSWLIYGGIAAVALIAIYFLVEK